MCWSSKTLEKRIATEDIKTFKVGFVKGTMLYSYYRWFHYDINRLYETTIYPDDIERLYRIYTGFHSYSHKKCSYFCKTEDRHINVQSKINGKLIDRYYDNDIMIFECTIPKGTEYYKNERGEIVSEAIIINKIIE